MASIGPLHQGAQLICTVVPDSISFRPASCLRVDLEKDDEWMYNEFGQRDLQQPSTESCVRVTSLSTSHCSHHLADARHILSRLHY